jgi:hypothetical protein
MKTDKGKSHVDVEAAVTCVRKLPRIIFQRVAFAYKYNLLIFGKQFTFPQVLCNTLTYLISTTSCSTFIPTNRIYSRITN